MELNIKASAGGKGPEKGPSEKRKRFLERKRQSERRSTTKPALEGQQKNYAICRKHAQLDVKNAATPKRPLEQAPRENSEPQKDRVPRPRAPTKPELSVPAQMPSEPTDCWDALDGAIAGSRKRPSRSSDEAYATYHLSAADLSVHAKEEPVASKKSSHLFDATTFASMAIHPKLIQVVVGPRENGGLGLERPTMVQRKTVPSLLLGKSTFIKSQTGSGKVHVLL